ncbi:Ig-like domain-containing protein [Staphylococcus delphini]|uniref:Ig-like domain-containing protein n=1 Tax=Staphylococcus delphini TaxID=53344 RepID=UPI000F702255|nr:Bacterial Ig-like domain (group 2) [Staphylococcus delphini]
MKVGNKFQLPVTVTPEERVGDVKYSSSHEQYATVSPTGEVEAKAAGITTVTATLDGSSAKITISVEENADVSSDEEEDEVV